jgi:hypothetical protein
MPNGSPGSLVGLKGWSTSGKITTRTTQAVQLQVQFDDPGYYTVQFNLAFTGSGIGFDCRAEIIWSVKGNSVRRLVTVSDGLSISGCGEAVKVRIFDNSQLPLGNLEYLVSVQVTPGSRPSEADVNPLLQLFASGSTTYVELLPAGNNIFFPIPSDSGALSVYITARFTFGAAAGLNIADTDLYIEQLSGRKICGGSSLYQFVPLAAAVNSIQIFNISALNMFISCAVGIEG